MPITVDHDPEADALYITLEQKMYHHGRDLDDQRRIDYAEDGSVRGVEILYPSDGVDLRDLPRADEIADALRPLGIRVLA
jgi:uncharacterized protein YuzE